MVLCVYIYIYALDILYRCRCMHECDRVGLKNKCNLFSVTVLGSSQVLCCLVDTNHIKEKENHVCYFFKQSNVTIFLLWQTACHRQRHWKRVREREGKEIRDEGREQSSSQLWISGDFLYFLRSLWYKSTRDWGQREIWALSLMPINNSQLKRRLVWQVLYEVL